MLKISLLFKKFTDFTANKSRIRRIWNAKFSGYCFYMNANIFGDFQIYISVTLSIIVQFVSDHYVSGAQKFSL